MFGFIKEQDGNAVIANRIYETRLYNWFLSEEMVNSSTYEAALLDKSYMLSFNFNKNKQVGVREIIIGDKVLVEAVV